MQHSEGTLTAFDGLSLFHQAWRPDGEPRGAIMLIHGLGEHSGRYQHVAAALVDAGYAVHAIDHRGHGRSEGKRVYVKSYDELMRDLGQFRRHIDAAEPGRPLFVLGHSMGGNLAMGHVLGNQDGIAGLVLSGPALQPGDDLSPLKLSIFKAVAKVAPGLRPEGLDATKISRDPAVVEAYQHDPLVFTGKMTAGIGAALIGAMERFPASYDQLTIPILLLHGTEDQLCDIAGSKAVETGAVNADVTAHYYDGLYHEVFNEPEHDRVLADLVAWLDGVVA
jgi:alpha-beta hydrolase superfamily lysophospholipase